MSDRSDLIDMLASARVSFERTGGPEGSVLISAGATALEFVFYADGELRCVREKKP